MSKPRNQAGFIVEDIDVKLRSGESPQFGHIVYGFPAQHMFRQAPVVQTLRGTSGVHCPTVPGRLLGFTTRMDFVQTMAASFN